MSRLDQHVNLVRNKLALNQLVRTWAWAGTALGSAVLVTVLVVRMTQLHLPRPAIWFWSALGVAVVAPLIAAMLRRPTARQAAVAIDERLGLKEKFSTALYFRPLRDPFAAAAVRDAEKTADSVSLHQKFPMPYPRPANATFAVALVALAALFWFPRLDLFGVEQRRAFKAQEHAQAEHAALNKAHEALAEIDAAPREVAENEQIRLAKREMLSMLEKPGIPAPQVSQKAQDTLKEIEAVKQQIANTRNFAKSQEELNNLKDIAPLSPSETGPVADAQRALAAGKLDEAVNDLKKSVDNFDKMNEKEKEKAAQQMKNLANQIAQKANDPKTQQAIQKQLQQAGATQQQAEQMSKLMQQAALGDKQAAQQLQQAANQAIQQANQQQGMTKQQQQAVANAIKQATQQGQQQANGQAGAQQMAQAMQGLSQAMQQAAQGGQGKAGQGQQAGQQAQANAGQSGQQGQQQGQAGQQGQGQGQGQGQAGQSAQQQMQQQVSQLQAMAKDAQAVAAAQQGAGQGQNGQGQQGPQGNGQFGQGNNGGQFAQGNPQPQQGQGGQGGPAIAAGGKRPDPVAVPYQVKQEVSQSQTIEDGKILAKSFVKAPSEKGESKITLSKAIEAESKDAADEVDQERIPRGAQKAVKDYFETLKQSPPK